MSNPDKEEILKLKKELNLLENKINEYTETIKNIEYSKKIKKLFNIGCYISSFLIALAFGSIVSFEAFIATFFLLSLIQNAIFLVTFDTKKEMEDNKKYIREKRKDCREQIEKLESKIYFLENTKANDEIKNNQERINIENFSKYKYKNKIKKLVQ